MTRVVTIENTARAFAMWTALSWGFAFLRDWRIGSLEDIGLGLMGAVSLWAPVAVMFPLLWGPVLQRLARTTVPGWAIVAIGAALMAPLGAWPPALFSNVVGQAMRVDPLALRTLWDAALSEDAGAFYVLYALLGAAMSLRFAVMDRERRQPGGQPVRP
jgi:hypothetical protein